MGLFDENKKGLFDDDDDEFDDWLDSLDKYPSCVNELNEGNVQALFNKCLATKESSSTLLSDLFPAGFGYGNMVGAKRHFFNFDQEILLKNKKTIQYLFGQLQVTHEPKESLSIDDFWKNYSGQNWTTQEVILRYLLYLGNCSKINVIYPFNAHKNDTTKFVSTINPTLSPKDPNFPAWWEEHKREWEGND